ncbi:MAG: hypothetical protein ACP5UN_00700 [Candidatus Micrarchaeia archaeon]
MIKNIVYVGIIIIILSFLFLFFASSTITSTNLNSTISSLISEKNYTINSNSFASYKINLNTTASIAALVSSNANINLYLMSSNAFLAWKNTLSNASNNASGINIASKFEGDGVYYIFKDINSASIPVGLIKNITAIPIYSSNSLLTNGTYYLVVDNTRGSASSNQIVNTTILYIPPLTNQTLNSPQFSQIKNMINESILLGSIFFITFIIGVAVLIYGLIKKPQNVVVESKGVVSKISLADVNKLYEGIEDKTNKGGKGRKSNINKKIKKVNYQNKRNARNNKNRINKNK